MKKTVAVLSLSLFAFATLSLAQTQVDPKWQIHDPNRLVPPVIDSGTASTQETPGRPPSDAIVLFDGKDLSKCQRKHSPPAHSKLQNAYSEPLPHTRHPYTPAPLP